MDVMQVLRAAVDAKASDVIITAGAPVTLHVHGVLQPLDPTWILTPKEAEDLTYQFLTSQQRKIFENERELDAAYQVPDLARFRVSAYLQRGTVACVLRLVPLEIPTPEAIGLEQRVLMEMVNTNGGLILITGPTGAGKSTTIASYVEYLNAHHGIAKHIITIEDPIEFLFVNKKCVIDQREIGFDTKSYVRGLKAALRQMPHVIFVGEMRDRETMEVALTAAETGNTVISTLSTQSAAKSINRIIDVFPLEHQNEIRTRLSLTLKIVVSQVLLQRVDTPGRVAAREIMFVSSPIANLIRENKVHQVNNAISTSYGDGMRLMDDSLVDLNNQQIIGYGDVVTRVSDTEKLKRAKRRT
ncbi:MAG: type IV pili twitching motility protein PilT [Verrucomicrobia bacterium]|nr:MAG: type IV pili twitching motility protein PilT [Verrucomicrobiota bacterium]